MQSLWQHPHFTTLKETASFGIDLRSEDLHTDEREQKLNLKAPYWNVHLTHQDFSCEGFRQLAKLALARQALNWMQAMQKGELVNSVEGAASRFAALHTALRASSDQNMLDVGKKVYLQAKQERARIRVLLNHHLQFKTLIVLGIGGSQLGPDALCEALKPIYPRHRRVIFVPNIDPQTHAQWLEALELKSTLVVVISKSGSTLETAESDKWWRQKLQSKGLEASKQMVCITTPGSKLDRAGDFLERFYFDPSIGGRYSATSSVGALTVGFGFGMDVFEELLEGAAEMDAHALKDDNLTNAPLALACVSIWQRQIRKRACQGIIAYRQGLHRFAAHLQQLEMESLGKSTDKEMKPLEGFCGALILGEPGTCAQHSFFQWMHQGTDTVPIDFIVETDAGVEGEGLATTDERSMADQLLANALAQSLALAKGKKAEMAHQSCPGNRPSTILACRKLTPGALGALLALYEHKTAFEGFILGINPFDQEGVELGKHMARELYDELQAYRRGDLKTVPWWQQIVKG